MRQGHTHGVTASPLVIDEPQVWPAELLAEDSSSGAGIHDLTLAGVGRARHPEQHSLGAHLAGMVARPVTIPAVRWAAPSGGDIARFPPADLRETTGDAAMYDTGKRTPGLPSRRPITHDVRYQ